jgi:hypothetical protein
MESEPVQEALFQIEGPDEDGCVWVWTAGITAQKAEAEDRQGPATTPEC